MQGTDEVQGAPVTRGPSPQPEAAEQPWPPRRDAYISLFVMTIVVMFTVIDRQILSIMIEPMKADFDITDTQVALLLGAAFSITYGLAGIPIARIADRSNRRNLIAISLAFWSTCTMLCGVAQNYTGMFLARLGIGMGESGYGPAAWSIATDNFPREKVAVATGTYGIGAMMGIGLASFMGGAILALVEGMPEIALPFGGVIRPWQWAFVVVGLPGLLWAIAVMMTKEPPRRGRSVAMARRNVPVRDILSWLANDWRTYIAVIGGAGMKILVTAGQSTWGVTFYHREFGWSVAQAGMAVGLMTLIVSPVAMVLGGKLSERWAMAGRSDANLRIVIYGLLGSVPILTIAPQMPTAWSALAMNGLGVFIGTLGFGPGFASFQVITPNSMRAQVSSLSQFCTNVIAFAMAPLIVALFTDYLFKDPAALKYSMSLSTLTMGILALFITIQGLKPYARSYERAVRDNL
jgi:MFS family permease